MQIDILNVFDILTIWSWEIYTLDIFIGNLTKYPDILNMILKTTTKQNKTKQNKTKQKKKKILSSPLWVQRPRG